ncbi:hypothetical protein BH10ACT1_BH10ACT1_34130 [soil metagenome]
MKRFLGFLLVTGMLFGGASCSSSGSDKKADAPATSEEKSGEGTSGNADVAAYCKAVDAYVAKAKDAMDDPDKAQALTAEAQDLSTKATALATAGLTADDAKDVGDCTKKSTDALLPG